MKLPQRKDTMTSNSQAIEMIQESNPRAPRILAKTFYRELLANGYSQPQIVQFAAELIGYLNKNLDGKNGKTRV